jgi:hypothetical protein
MKKLYSIFLVLAFSTSVAAQDLLTIGEVFDFSVGDKFQISGIGNGQPPNCDRITITGKYYSMDSDTLYYVRYHDSYNSEMLMELPYITYHFWTKTDTVFYSGLDLNITHFRDWVAFDTSMYAYDTINAVSETYCDSILNGLHFEKNAFEPDKYIINIGKEWDW